jgi:hypothetical protein
MRESRPEVDSWVCKMNKTSERPQMVRPVRDGDLKENLRSKVVASSLNA